MKLLVFGAVGWMERTNEKYASSPVHWCSLFAVCGGSQIHFHFRIRWGSSKVPVLQRSVHRSNHAVLQCELGSFEGYHFK